MLFIIRFILLFIIKGLIGVILTNFEIDIVLYCTYYVVVHFHYILLIKAFFAMFVVFLLLN